jgi:hypothetical protein
MVPGMDLLVDRGLAVLVDGLRNCCVFQARSIRNSTSLGSLQTMARPFTMKKNLLPGIALAFFFVFLFGRFSEGKDGHHR